MAYRGKSLRSLRERKNIHLRHISEKTRITTWYLAGIEEERFDRFPGKFYFRSFTREYARSLGLDPSDVLQDLQPAYEEWHRDRPSRNGNGERPTDERNVIARLAGRLFPPEV
jgi:cytoskeletal protein RodZ